MSTKERTDSAPDTLRGKMQDKLDDLRAAAASKRVIAGIALGAVVPGVAACGPTEHEVPVLPTVTTEAPATVDTPTASPTESEKPAWYYEEDIILREDPLPAELQPYQDMNYEDGEFVKLPKAEQWLYASWLTQNRLEFEAWADSPEKTVTLTANSTFNDVLADLAYSYQLAAYQTVGDPEPQADGTCGTLDKDSAYKIIAAASVNESNAQIEIDMLDLYTEGRAYCPSKITNQGRYSLLENFTVTSIEETLKDPNSNDDTDVKVQTFDITYTDAARPGLTFSAYLYNMPITTYAGEVEYHAVLGVYEIVQN